MPEETSIAKTGGVHWLWHEEVTVEFSGPRNCCPAFPPEKQIFRGEMRRDRLLPDEGASDDIKRLPDVIPGMRLTVNGRHREGRIWDPLGTPEYAPLMERMAWVNPTNTLLGMPGMRKYSPEPTKEKKLSASELKTWLYWLVRLQADGMIKLVDGRLPTLEQIARMEGKTEIECWRQGAGKRYLEDRKPEQVPAA